MENLNRTFLELVENVNNNLKVYVKVTVNGEPKKITLVYKNNLHDQTKNEIFKISSLDNEEQKQRLIAEVKRAISKL